MMKVVLISPYEIGRQPFGLAEPAAVLRGEDCDVTCIDLSIDRIEPELVEGADLIAIYLAMHTATRLAIQLLPRLREMAPEAHLCAYGLYAPMNVDLLRANGVGTVLGGEFEPGLLSMVRRLRTGSRDQAQTEPLIGLSKVEFLVPDRSGLPELSKYSHLILPDGSTKLVGFAEASRGCKHVCRHCPVVPVYAGRFRVVPPEVVLADIRNQVKLGAEHISFGDPDFLNGPTHAMQIVRSLHEEFPEISFDAVIKVEHLLKHRELLPSLRDAGCRLITTAVESFDGRILDYFDKGHSSDEIDTAVGLLREVGIPLAPTFVPFTPWTTLEGYLAFLERLIELRLVSSVPPIQLAIRLLVPQGSYLLRLEGFGEIVGPFDPELLGYPWKNPDPRVDALQRRIEAWVGEADAQELPRRDTFLRIREMAYVAAGSTPQALDGEFLGEAVPHLSEPWYCCAEPTSRQLEAL